MGMLPLERNALGNMSHALLRRLNEIRRRFDRYIVKLWRKASMLHHGAMFIFVRHAPPSHAPPSLKRDLVRVCLCAISVFSQPYDTSVAPLYAGSFCQAFAATLDAFPDYFASSMHMPLKDLARMPKKFYLDLAGADETMVSFERHVETRNSQVYGLSAPSKSEDVFEFFCVEVIPGRRQASTLLVKVRISSYHTQHGTDMRECFL